MIVYNMDFLIAALVFLLLLLFHFMNERKLVTFSGRIFRWFIMVGIADILLDLVCTLMISSPRRILTPVMYLALTLLYVLQILVPYAFVCYAKALRVTTESEAKKIIRFWAVPAGIMVLLVVTNFWTHIFFTVTAEGAYIRGPLYLGMYAHALTYVLLAAVDSLVHYKQLGLKKFVTVWEFMAIAGVCVSIQAYNNDLLMTGFGISLGITVLYLTLHTPYGFTDSLTGLYDKQYYEDWCREQMEKGRTLHVISVDVHRIKHINKVMGISAGDRMLVRVADALREISGSKQVFRVGGNRFLLITNSLDEYERCRKGLQKFFGRVFEMDGETFHFPAIICGIPHGEKLFEQDSLLAYIEYLVAIVPDTEELTVIQSDAGTLDGFRYEQEIERFLNTALEEDLFEVYYQPVYSFAHGRYTSLEALSRLRPPALGMVSPEGFITIAERTKQVSQMG